jgi:tetratricopeptide (TPR) repeat protein
MNRGSRWPTKVVGSLLVGTMLGGLIPSGTARADLVSTESIITRATTAEWDRARLRALLAREDVRAQLQADALNDLPGAEQAFRLATRQHPGAAAAFDNLAHVLLELGRHEEARVAAQRALDLAGSAWPLRGGMDPSEDWSRQ